MIQFIWFMIGVFFTLFIEFILVIYSIGQANKASDEENY